MRGLSAGDMWSFSSEVSHAEVVFQHQEITVQRAKKMVASDRAWKRARIYQPSKDTAVRLIGFTMLHGSRSDMDRKICRLLRTEQDVRSHVEQCQNIRGRVQEICRGRAGHAGTRAGEGGDFKLRFRIELGES